jgi:hypothetical protein
MAKDYADRSVALILSRVKADPDMVPQNKKVNEVQGKYYIRSAKL